MTGQRDHTHVLSGDAGIKNAAEVVTGLREALATHAAIRVDSQALTAADITTVQSLIAASIAADQQGKRFSLDAPIGAPLASVLRDAGLLAPDQPHRALWAPLSLQP